MIGRPLSSLLEEVFPADLQNWGGPEVVPALPAEPQAEVVDDDVLDHPFQEDAGGALAQWMMVSPNLNLFLNHIL